MSHTQHDELAAPDPPAGDRPGVDPFDRQTASRHLNTYKLFHERVISSGVDSILYVDERGRPRTCWVIRREDGDQPSRPFAWWQVEDGFPADPPPGFYGTGAEL